MMIHPTTGFALGDPDHQPLSVAPSAADARKFFDSLILSASGWRGVFGAHDDDLSETVRPAALYAAARMADVFATFLLETHAAASMQPVGGHDAPAAAAVSAALTVPAAGQAVGQAAGPVLALGLDTRPTGPAIADVMARVFMARGIRVRYAYICAAPEIMAWARRSGALPAGHEDRLDAFCYISASHNPPGHNGVKFGLVDGGVLPASQTGMLIARLADGACTDADIADKARLAASVSPRQVSSLFSGAGREKRKAISDYILFTREVAGNSDLMDRQERELDTLASSIRERGAGIVAEMNGSARSLSIDLDFLGGLGVEVRPVNATPRAFAHRIVPEGESLEPCRQELAARHADDPAFVLGYVPDCDGDRGNIVYWNDDEGDARTLEAQEGFALAILAELAVMASRPADPSDSTQRKLAVACNDATSMRVEAIAGAFGARVFRAETGEANVVGLARSLREQGYTVRVLGEGSNGGVITHPASVRDPINTITAILKLLYLRGGETAPGIEPYRRWLERTGRLDDYHDEFALCDMLASLPRFATTSVFESRAALRIRCRNHTALKNAYETIFRKSWPALAAMLEPTFGPLGWTAMASSGSTEAELAGPFGNSGTGGLRIVMTDRNKVPAAFLWMRGSGTEPVFRIMADVRGDDGTLEALLLERHAAMVREADSIAQ